jgi:ABC transporter substrate binding protein
MKRREFIALLGGAAVAWPLAARAQQPDRLHLGVIGPARDSGAVRFAYPVLLEELRKLGFAESRNLIVEFRRVDEGVPKAFTGANELVAAKANVLFAFGPELALQAADAARPAVPIVILAVNYDPIARGYVKSLAQPGGNVTGIVSRQLELAAKQLALLAEAFPACQSQFAVGDRSDRGGVTGALEGAPRPTGQFGPAQFHIIPRPPRRSASTCRRHYSPRGDRVIEE